jgi:hypothetical protein
VVEHIGLGLIPQGERAYSRDHRDRHFKGCLIDGGAKSWQQRWPGLPKSEALASLLRNSRSAEQLKFWPGEVEKR